MNIDFAVRFSALILCVVAIKSATPCWKQGDAALTMQPLGRRPNVYEPNLNTCSENSQRDKRNPFRVFLRLFFCTCKAYCMRKNKKKDQSGNSGLDKQITYAGAKSSLDIFNILATCRVVNILTRRGLDGAVI